MFNLFNITLSTLFLFSFSYIYSEKLEESLFVKEVNEPVENKKSFLPFLLSSSIIPGSGQFMLDHKIKGSFIFSGELILLTSGLNDGFYLTNKWNTAVSRIDKRLNSPFSDYDISFVEREVSSDSLAYIDLLENYKGKYEYSRALRDRTVAWVSGFHLFNILDTYGYFCETYRKKPTRKLNPTGALLRSLILPGLGQLYNREYSKFGAVIMSMVGLGTNIYVWNRAADYHIGREESYQNQYNIIKPGLDLILSKIDNAKSSIEFINGQLKNDLSEIERESLTLRLDTLNTNVHSDSLILGKYRKEESFFTERISANNYNGVKLLSSRNQNIWYMFAIYLFSAFDAFVDAHLSNFEKNLEITVVPEIDGLKMSAKYNF